MVNNLTDHSYNNPHGVATPVVAVSHWPQVFSRHDNAVQEPSCAHSMLVLLAASFDNRVQSFSYCSSVHGFYCISNHAFHRGAT